mmetsp:Transcript_3747/g.7846  ORF Transcript_3747/g.7846 Transcript_3747/m.7846 type:complete len:86 (-) Transcript_3747:196-453(-)
MVVSCLSRELSFDSVDAVVLDIDVESEWTLRKLLTKKTSKEKHISWKERKNMGIIPDDRKPKNVTRSRSPIRSRSRPKSRNRSRA